MTERLMLLIVLVAATVVMLVPLAEAQTTTCGPVVGEVVRVQEPAAAGGVGGIYIRPSSITTFVYFGTTPDRQILQAANTAAANRTRVQATGRTAVECQCQTTGETRNICTIISLTLAP